MLCQNCGRRSPDSHNFCQHCGAIGSDDAATVPSPRASDQSVSQPSPPAVLRPRQPQPRLAPRQAGSRPARGGSNAFSTLLFWGLVAYGAYWFMSDDQREIRTMLQQWLQEQTASQAPPPRRTAPAGTRPADAPARPAAPTATPSAGKANDARGSAQPPTTRGAAPLERGTVPVLQPRAVSPPAGSAPSAPAPTGAQRSAPPPSDIEGMSPGQVLQRLGRPSGVVTREGLTAWTYQNGTIVVYFVKDRATLKPPRI